MSTLKNNALKLASVALLGIAACMPAVVSAQANAAHGTHGTHATPATDAANAKDAAPTQGEVRKVDKDNQKITLRHEAIKNLDMPPMTMVFQVSDPALLDKVKAGDKVRFTATGDGGKYTVTGIETAK